MLIHKEVEVEARSGYSAGLRISSPDGPKNGNFQTPRRGLIISGMVSLGVGKRQTRAVSLKTALISPLNALAKMLKLFSYLNFKRIALM